MFHHLTLKISPHHLLLLSGWIWIDIHEWVHLDGLLTCITTGEFVPPARRPFH
ncbi:hypothetical protein GA0061070_103413 [Kosakonia oryziphila]|uniref:Uncharacterized protein n=1 Tax=Kosakonia oryziphila TaxID=1005667 RepID=A0A1C4FBX4_9ENTR|nr:hypothetical protein GA0061070_103413 [Kosakonia oryziphila]